MGDFTVQCLANTAWAFATASQSDVSLFRALARATERSVGYFIMQGLVNTAWAFVNSGQSDVSLFSALARAAKLGVGD